MIYTFVAVLLGREGLTDQQLLVMNVAKGMTLRNLFSKNFHSDRAIVSSHCKSVQTQLGNICYLAAFLGLESVQALR